MKGVESFSHTSAMFVQQVQILESLPVAPAQLLQRVSPRVPSTARGMPGLDGDDLP